MSALPLRKAGRFYFTTMTKPKTAVAGLAILAVVLLVIGLIRSAYTGEDVQGMNGSGMHWGLTVSPLVFIGLLLIALAFGWHKFGR